MVRPAVSQQLVGVSRRDRVALKGLVACVRVTHLAVCADRSGCLRLIIKQHRQLILNSCLCLARLSTKVTQKPIMRNCCSTFAMLGRTLERVALVTTRKC